jgi:hypothetical protein
VEPKSFRRFLLNGVLPLSLLLIAGLFTQWLTSISAVQTTSSEIGKTRHSVSLEQKIGNSEADRLLRDAHRKAALDTIERLEAEARLKEGVPSIASDELKRLRNAIL